MGERKQFTFADYLERMKKIRQISFKDLKDFFDKCPDPSLKNLDWDDVQKGFISLEAMITSMTPGERENPELIDGARRKRIAGGSGTNSQKVKETINEFLEMREWMKKKLGEDWFHRS